MTRHAAQFLLLAGFALLPNMAVAHVSEQGLVLLLPTGHYIAGGVFAVAASILLVSLTPPRFISRLFRTWPTPLPSLPASTATSLFSFALLLVLLAIGITGSRDPLSNLLPLTIWTAWWIGLFTLVGIFGNLWRWLNPWTGLFQILFGDEHKPVLTLPAHWSVLPALILFFAFATYYTIAPAPSDPERLAFVVAVYWCLTFACMITFGGEMWLQRGEAFSVLYTLIARVSPFGAGNHRTIGFPGWALLPDKPLALGLGIFALVILGVGSFDGLKETFFWLGVIDVNPLAFPGRTAVMTSSLIGLVAATVGLTLTFWIVVWATRQVGNRGLKTADQHSTTMLFRMFAPTVLPIALGYHISHFLIGFLVDAQYLLAALGDPFGTGANIFGLADTRVTTGFLKTPASVQTIWLTQAGIVVAGHVLSVVASHHVALRAFGTPRRATLSQIPLGGFMVLYTLFGLWLLATPRGM